MMSDKTTQKKTPKQGWIAAQPLIAAAVLLTVGGLDLRLAQADESQWTAMAAQTCMAQAPYNPAVAKLNLSAEHLNYTCHCTARKIYPQLSDAERQDLWLQMQNRNNMQSVGAQLFGRNEVKQSTMACSVAYYWRR